MKYAYVCVAGTFDGLHAGHTALLLRAFAIGKRVLIGITSQYYLQEHKPDVPVSSYDNRLSFLTGWVMKHGFADRSVMVSIDSPFEPAASDPFLEAIVVSEQSLARAEELNRIRALHGHKALVIDVVPMVYAEDHKPISATRIRTGIIDGHGKLIMPGSLRNDLAMPLGTVLSHEKIAASFKAHAGKEIISVGDLTTKTLLDAGILPRLMIIDNKVNRAEFRDLKPLIMTGNFDTRAVSSGPGFISGEALHEIREILSSTGRKAKPVVLEVHGEEDLLALPAILEAPIGAILYYGQPARQDSEPHPPAGGPAWSCGPELSGIVEVMITEEKKKAAQSLLTRFTQ